MSEKTKALLALALMVVMIIAAIITLHWRIHADDDLVTDEVIEANIERLEHMGEEVPEATEPPEPVHILYSEDVTLLAKIMQAEAGHEWPDAMIMCIGEVVLNRVASPEFPDTIRGVLYQTDGGYIQYAPVHYEIWDSIEPEERYIELALRLLGGERVLYNPQIVYQALFEQGSDTVLTYKDLTLGSTTYFCRTYYPELYE